MGPEMCVDTHRPFCYSTRLTIYTGVSTGALRSGLGESKKQSKGRKMIMKAYARVKMIVGSGTNEFAQIRVCA
jgi:hypothetical protein